MAPSSLRMGLLGGITTILYGSSVVAANDLSNDPDLLKYVDPLIGTAKGGLLSTISDIWLASSDNRPQDMFLRELLCHMVRHPGDDEDGNKG